MNLLDQMTEDIGYFIEMFYAPTIDLATAYDRSVWAVAMALKFENGKPVPRPKSLRAHTVDSLTASLVERLMEMDGEFEQQLPLGLALWKPRWGKSITQKAAHAPSTLFLDIDVANGGHTDKALPMPTRAQAEAVMAEMEAEFGFTFTAVAETSGDENGNIHAYVFLDRPITTELLARWNQAARAAFAAAGLHLDALPGTGAQMVRAVGTMNVKAGRRSRWIRKGTDRVDAGDLMRALPATPYSEEKVFPMNVITLENVFEAPEGEYAVSGRAYELAGRPGDAFAALVSPMDLLCELLPMNRTEDGATYYREDGTVNEGELHVKPTMHEGEERVFIWGQRLADTFGGGHTDVTRRAYNSFGIICNLFLEGDFNRTSFLLGHLYRKVGGGQAWVNEVVSFLTANPDKESIIKALPKPKKAVAKDAPRYSRRAA
jgi:hypothetical protein